MQFRIDEECRDISERRAFARVPFGNPVEFRSRGSAVSAGSLPCDISQGGIRVNLNAFVPLNEELDLHIQLDPERVVACNGKVVWIRRVPFSERYQAGLKFLEGDTLANAQATIKGFVAACNQGHTGVLKGA